MKKLTLMLVTIIISFYSISQSPQAFKYQAVARDNAGNVLATTNVTFRIGILQGSASGTNVYTETHDTITNEFGLVNLVIGNGAVVNGLFADIDWGDGPYFLQIEMDATGGNNYQLMGTSQLLSVPYSLYSESTGDTTRWQKNNNDLYFNNGNVGIGTDTPDGSLDVRSTGTDEPAMFRLGNSDVSHSLSFFPGRENDPNPFIQWKEGDPLRFSTDEGGWSEKMRITSDGMVGIGTPDPAGILDIAGEYHFPSTDGTIGQVLQTDGNGILNWSASGENTSDSIVIGGPTTAADERWYIGMEINGITGPWNAPDCFDCIKVFDLDWFIYKPVDAATGWPTGQRRHNALTVYKNIDMASVLLLKNLVDNEIIDEMKLKFYQEDPGNPGNFQIYYTITLENARVVDFHHSVYHRGNDGFAHLDKVSFVYQTIEWLWEDGGMVHQDEWFIPDSK